MESRELGFGVWEWGVGVESGEEFVMRPNFAVGNEGLHLTSGSRVPTFKTCVIVGKWWGGRFKGGFSRPDVHLGMAPIMLLLFIGQQI